MKRLVISTTLHCGVWMHPRLYRWLWQLIWPFVREPDGYVGIQYGNIEMRVDLREDAERQIYLGNYDPALIMFLSAVLRPGDIVVDAGANAGIVSVTAANAVKSDGKVLSIEPNPELAARLQDLADRNPLGNLNVLPVAVSDNTGASTLFISASHPYSSLDIKELPDYPIREQTQVRVETLDAICARILNNKPVRLLKVDVQGYESKVLQGAQNLLNSSPPTYIVLEFMGDGFEEILEQLRVRDYKEFEIDESGNLHPREGALSPGANLVMWHQP